MSRFFKRGLPGGIFFLVFLSLNHAPVLASNPAPYLEEVSDRKYLPRLLELIRGARTEIEISIYQILFAEDDETHPVYQILKALAEARSRGIKIRVILNRYFDYSAGDTVPLARSLAAHEYLKRKGIEVVFAHPSRRLHDKVIVIDGRWVVEGSMNWTKTALESNWESATLIDSADYAAVKLTRIRAIPVSIDETPDTLGDEGPMLEIPSILMTDRRYFPDLLRRKDETIFEFYLGLLLESRRSGKENFILGDAALFERFHLNPEKSQKDKRREAVRLLKKLKKKGLIELNIPTPGSDVGIALRPPGDRPTRGFKLPLAYFDYDYPRRLSFAAEFVYLLARLEMSESSSPPWWWRSQEDLTGTYHLHHTTLADGMLELMHENLIEIIRDDAPEGHPHSERLVNRYRMNRIVSAAAKEEQEKRLAQKFGTENFNRAKQWADGIDEPKDPLVIATILQWMTLYPREDLEAAFRQISAYERNNPRRSLYYLRGILERKSTAAPSQSHV